MGVSEQSIRAYCSHGQIDGVIKNGNKYRIPANAIKPLDGRNLRAKTYKSSYAKMFITADTLKKEFLNPSLPVCVDDSRLYSDFLAEYIYNSNAFEGNSLTLFETSLVIHGELFRHKPVEDHFQAIGHRDAFEYVQKMVKCRSRLSESLIGQLYFLMKLNVDKYKTFLKFCSSASAQEYMEHTDSFYCHPDLRNLISENVKHKKDVHPLERIAIFHLEFEGLYSFTKGYGSLARLIMNYELMKDGYKPIYIKFKSREKYCEAFESYKCTKSPEKIIEIITECLVEQYKKYFCWRPTGKPDNNLVSQLI